MIPTAAEIKDFERSRRARAWAKFRWRLREWLLCNRWMRRDRHEWSHRESEPFKRTCARCGRHEWMFSRPYPSTTRPSLIWQRMALSDREDRLYDALKQLVGWIEEGCHDEARQYVLTEARAALKDLQVVQ